MLKRLAPYIILVAPCFLIGCMASAEPGDDDSTSQAGEERTGTAADDIYVGPQCPRGEQPCTCSGGPHSGQTICTSNLTQCFDFCA